jgi:hypothetical protein
MKPKSQLIERNTVRFSLPLDPVQRATPVENCVIDLGNSLSIDVGALCYTVRASGRRRRGQGRHVALSSLLPSRRKIVSDLIDRMSQQVSSGVRIATVHRSVSNFVHFVDCHDSTFADDMISTGERAREAIEWYVGFLKGKVKSGKLSTNTAWAYQSEAIRVLTDFHDVADLAEGIGLIKKSSRAVKNTVPPSEDDQGQQLLLSKSLFEGLTKLALSKAAKFPYALPVPHFLGMPSDRLWVFPARGLFRTSAEHERNLLEGRRGNWAFDFDEGRVRTVDEIKQHYASRESALNVVRLAARNISDANRQNRHAGRLEAGMVAHDAFVDLFIAATGQPVSAIAAIPWSSKNYTVERTPVQGFRSIKWRAGNRRLEFVVAGDFLPLFRRFIELRTWLLKKNRHRNLFFSADIVSGKLRLKSLVANAASILYYHKRLAPHATFLGCAKWKSAKNNHTADKHGVAIGAKIAQNSEGVFGRHYVTGTPTKAIRQLGSYFAKVEVSVVRRREDALGKESAVGGCANFEHPVPLNDEAPVAPDCSQPEGCLFCKQLYLVADEKDVRKLASCRYCIQSTKSLSKNADAWRETFRDILERIETLIERIASRSESHRIMVERVVSEVENDGELDPYWDAKLEMLSNLQLGATK